MNLRTSYSRTLARPTFREFSPFANLNTAGAGIDIGNPGLERTLIDNVDLRWEYFPTPNELVSVSLFYKDFQNPIEKVSDRRGIASVLPGRMFRMLRTMGLSLSSRRNFGFIGDGWEYLQFGGNVAIIRSLVDEDSAAFFFAQQIDSLRDSRRVSAGDNRLSSSMRNWPM